MKKILIFAFTLFLILPLFSSGEREKGVTIITIWHPNSGLIGEAFEELVNDFNQTVGKDENIQIEAVYQGLANDVLTKVKAAAISKTLPDIAQMDATAATDMNNADYLVTMRDLGLREEEILINARNAFSSEKGLLAMPFNASSLLLYYNKDVFEENGVEPPKTFDEFIEIADKIGEKDEKGNVTRYALQGVPTTFELTSFIGAQNGLSYIVNKKNGHEGLPTEVLFGKEGTYKAFLEKWKELFDTGYLNSITSGVSTEFASGRSATMLQSSSNLSTVIDSVGDNFRVGVSEIPMVNEKATGGVAPSGGAMFAFTNSSEVRKVLEYFMRDDVQLKWAELTGYIPLNVNVYESEEYRDFIKENPNFHVAMSALNGSNPNLTNLWLPSAYQIYYSFQKNIDDVVNERITIDAAVDEMVTTIKDALESYEAQNIV